MAPRLVAQKTLLQIFLASRQQFILPRTSMTCTIGSVCGRTLIDNNKLSIATLGIIRRDTAVSPCSIVGNRRLKSTTNRNCCGTINFSTQVTSATAMNPPPKDETSENKNFPDDDDDLEVKMKQASNPLPRATYDDEDKYCVEIKDGCMKVSMKPVSTPEKEATASPNKTTCPSTANTKEENPTDFSDKQGNYRDGQTRIPETVLQFQRQLRKTQAAKRASTPLARSQLQIVYDDEHIVVVNKPSGVLTVPGINSNPSMLTVLYEKYKDELDPEMKPEHMIVHRLDMDTSGIVVYAKSKKNLLRLQTLFRTRDEVSKCYEAVVCGHLHPEVERGSIDLPLQRDHRFPPFMRVATPRSEREAQEVVKDLKKAGWKKIVKKKAKPSQTLFEVIGREYRCYNGDASAEDETECQDDENSKKGRRFPVTRLRLTLLTGRTHQLRVHCASIGHPILGDPAYGIYGEASANGGFDDALMDELVPTRASVDLQLALDQYVKDKGQLMCLHARELRVQHPETGEPLSFEQPPAF